MSNTFVIMADSSDRPDGANCEYCHSTEKLSRCTGCRAVFYCSREHQIQDWKKHKRRCKKNAPRAQPKGGTAQANSASIPSSMPTRANTNGQQGSKTPEISVYETAGQPGKTLQSELSRKANENTNVESVSELGQHDSGVKSRKTSTPCFDPRPFVHTDFAKPVSGDGDTIAKHAFGQLKKNGYCVLDGFLAENSGRSILDEVKAIQDSGILVDGPLSGGRTSSEYAKKFTEKAIRGDKITWLQGNEVCYPSIRALVLRTDELMQRLNYYLRGQYTISGRTKVMVACYPGNGTGYACHVDNPNRDGRCITCLYYLNDNWDVKTQGGLLRLFPASGGYVDIQPLLNRLLLFWSDRRNPHEVQPAFDMRYAITVWYFDKAEREEAKMAQLNEDMSRLRGEVSLPDIKGQKEEKDRVEQEIQKKSTSAIDGLSQEELQALSAMLEGQPDPRAVFTNLGVAPSIQDALLSQLKKSSSAGKH